MAHSLPIDILQLILDSLVGDSETLARAGLVCRSWHALSLPSLLKHVDLSSHNIGRLPEHEDTTFHNIRGIVMSDESDEYRPRSLVPRQRAFLRLMIDRPKLAVLVKALTWTLVWMDFDEDSLTDIDLQTWQVFGRMQNVARLDLASLHQISDQPYIWQIPARLFPAVTHLRLVGWMNRGLVKAIVSSLDPSKLHCLKLNHLQDEGALPNGEPMPADLASEHAHEDSNPYEAEGIGDNLWARQERGDAAIFPGPMWFPLRFLRQNSLSSMAHLQISLGPVSVHTHDPRNQITMFRDTAEFIKSAKNTLKTISIALGESPSLFYDEEEQGHLSTCGTSRVSVQQVYRPKCFDLTSVFLYRLLAALTEEQYPHLTRVDLKGFRIIQSGKSRMIRPPYTGLIWQYIRDCPFIDEEFMETANLDYRPRFDGYDYYLPKMDQDKLDELVEILKRS